MLVLTGLDDDNLGFMALRAGAQEFLPKRLLDPLLLERAIRHAMERASLRTELERQHQRGHLLAQRVAKADRLAAIGRGDIGLVGVTVVRRARHHAAGDQRARERRGKKDAKKSERRTKGRGHEDSNKRWRCGANA